MFPKTERSSVFQREPENTWHSPNAMQELYMLGLRPKPKRGLRPLHPGRGSPRGRSVKFSDIYTLSSDSKYSSERKSYPNTLQFKRFWRFQEPFFKRFLSPFRPFPPFPLPPRSGFRSGGGSIRGNISIPRYAVCGRDRRSTAAAVLSLSVPPYL